MEDERDVKTANTQPLDEQQATSYDLLYITRAYNRREISFEEWLRLSKEWAEHMIQQHGTAE